MSFGEVLLLVMTDGRRECIERSIPSAEENLQGPITRRVIHDDSGDDEYRHWLRERFPAYEVIYHPMGRQGFGGAIRTAWRHIANASQFHVLHLEDDFVFKRPVRLVPIMELLEVRDQPIQFALRRQPWNDEERAAGGIVEQHPEAYEDARCCPDHAWLEHRLFFTTNPSLYRRSLCSLSWPEGSNSEGMFSHKLLEDPQTRFAFWGARDSGEWVEHIGRERVGTGY